MDAGSNTKAGAESVAPSVSTCAATKARSERKTVVIGAIILNEWTWLIATIVTSEEETRDRTQYHGQQNSNHRGGSEG